MLRASWLAYDLHPYFSLGTSRGAITKRRVWFLKLWDPSDPYQFGIGEAAPLPGLSIESPEQVEEALDRIIADPHIDHAELQATPSVRFALEMAQADLSAGAQRLLFSTAFTEGKSSIPINGLVWMGDRDEMLKRLGEKIDAGFRCMKMKIGAIDRKQEFELLKLMRDRFPKEHLEIRVDANGAFSVAEAPAILEQLATLNIHSIEQVIKQGQPEAMASLCASTPIPIALDEELIGIDEKQALLDAIAPQYIILKPSLLGGFTVCKEWIAAAEERNIKWWLTSALESNIGLNAIAQWTATLANPLPQGLGTGALFSNNVACPLKVVSGALHYQPDVKWDITAIT